MAAISVDGLTKTYGDVVANDALTFDVEPGEVFGYLGPNGAGKTTTIRMLLGFHAPTAGSASVLGRDVTDERALIEAKQRVGYLPGTPAFDPGVTGREFLDYQARLKGDARLDDLLALFEPPLDRKVREYSTGNRQMLGIVQAFMHDPDLVVMDEPTSGLDPIKQARFHEFLRAERDRGVTVFFSSHALGEVQRVCDRVGVIRDGRLVALEDVSTLRGRGGKRVDLHVEGALDPGDIAVDGVTDLTAVADGVQFTYTGDYDALLDLLAGYDVADVTIEDPPLEDVFLRFYGERATARQADAGSQPASPATDEGADGSAGERTDGEVP